MGLWDSFTRYAGEAFKGIKSIVEPAAKAIAMGAKSAYQEGRSAVVTVYNDAKEYVKMEGATINHVIDKGADLIGGVVHTAGDTVSSLGQSLSLPLVMVGGAAALFFLMKK